MHGVAPEVVLRRPGAAAGLRRLVSASVCPNPNDRYGSAQELADAMRAASASASRPPVGVTPAVASGVPRSDSASRRPVRSWSDGPSGTARSRHPSYLPRPTNVGILAGVGAFLGMLLIGGVLVLTGRLTSRATPAALPVHAPSAPNVILAQPTAALPALDPVPPLDAPAGSEHPVDASIATPVIQANPVAAPPLPPRVQRPPLAPFPRPLTLVRERVRPARRTNPSTSAFDRFKREYDHDSTISSHETTHSLRSRRGARGHGLDAALRSRSSGR